MIKLIDFRNSNLLWLTNDGSYGRFSIDSVLEINNTKYFLTSGVMACNMYAESGLIKSPSYLFKAAFSENEYKIFRSSTDENIIDSKGKNSDNFKKIEFQIQQSNTTEVKINEIRNEILSGSTLIATAHVTTDFNYFFKLIFPIKHINYSETNKMFQTETGQILFPEFTNGNINLTTSYVAFNSLEKIDVIKRSEEKGNSNSFEKIVSYSCSIKIYNYSI